MWLDYVAPEALHLLAPTKVRPTISARLTRTPGATSCSYMRFSSLIVLAPVARTYYFHNRALPG
ncbi:hypothetical protein TWF132_001512 [Orbilia oligospora]|nr:hypothetical protein TWF132_001512 [Orbilia oligospora]